jgi:hypothetical protein
MLSAIRGIPAITEKLHLDIRVDASNLFNQAEFVDPIANIAMLASGWSGEKRRGKR